MELTSYGELFAAGNTLGTFAYTLLGGARFVSPVRVACDDNVRRVVTRAPRAGCISKAVCRLFSSNLGSGEPDLVGDGGRTTRPCRWCDLFDSPGHFVSEAPAYVVLAPGSSKCAAGHLTLLPRAHVALLTDLEPEDLASVLAGLSRLVRSLKEAYKVTEVEIRAHPRSPSGHHAHAHLHFHLIPSAVGAPRVGGPALKRRGA
jgi:diadenosine tetraphosphate (Ap4A) HIT family hydrolase